MAKKFGTGDFYIGALATTYGTISNYSEDDASDIQEGKDGDGNVDAVEANNRIITATMDIETDGTLPKSGETITGVSAQEGSVNFVVESVNNTQTNQGVSTASITAKHYPDNSIPAS